MDAQQLHDYIIKPTHVYMGGNYESKEANFLSLCTAAIESDCGYYIKQVDGPALGIWQMEPKTLMSTLCNCDALNSEYFDDLLGKLAYPRECLGFNKALLLSPMYACAMARLKYSMDPEPLPELTGDNQVDSYNFYKYYKRIYNTHLGASTFEKWQVKMNKHKIFNVKL